MIERGLGGQGQCQGQKKAKQKQTGRQKAAAAAGAEERTILHPRGNQPTKRGKGIQAFYMRGSFSIRVRVQVQVEGE
jgi:hypothetical protein